MGSTLNLRQELGINDGSSEQELVKERDELMRKLSTFTGKKELDYSLKMALISAAVVALERADMRFSSSCCNNSRFITTCSS